MMTETDKMEVDMEGDNCKFSLDSLKCLHWGNLNITSQEKEKKKHLKEFNREVNVRCHVQSFGLPSDREEKLLTDAEYTH